MSESSIPDYLQWTGSDLAGAVLTGEEIQQRVAELGSMISVDYKDSPPLLVCVLISHFHF